jgi:molybdopterin synthase sulfur carrier subunit
MVHSCDGGAYLFLFSSEQDGQCVADDFYATIQEAETEAKSHFGIDTSDWTIIDDPLPGAQHDWIRPTRIKLDARGNKLWGEFEPFSMADRLIVRVVIPYHLRLLSGVSGEVAVEVDAPVTQRAVLDALEARYPMLCGTIRDQVTKERRAFLRYYACKEDLSLESPDSPLPEAVASGKEPFLIVSAIAGG